MSTCPDYSAAGRGSPGLGDRKSVVGQQTRHPPLTTSERQTRFVGHSRFSLLLSSCSWVAVPANPELSSPPSRMEDRKARAVATAWRIPNTWCWGCGAVYGFDNLHWTDWGRPATHATGYTWGCLQSRCPREKARRFPVRLTLSKIFDCSNDERRYTRLTWRFLDAAPYALYFPHQEALFDCRFAGRGI
jgi:hypothetical protein